ncbi:polysialyltransferase family glycosyltransferase [Stutzerimonas nitrititolerans]|uniref:polysialyltransferase family glycosyltransferase n=1 Tax=Stutzerimonas nitrititolerans TaxID=2482751 RepID=UPI0028A6FA30|nr:polysialyltransferase family glycosyltransferase [Stutzerimonas nitrititolerans]
MAVYLVKTELEALASEIIAGRFEAQSHNLLAYSGKHEPHLINPDAFDICLALPSSSRRGIFSERRAICRNLELLVGELRRLNEVPDDIRIHLPRLSTSKSNYAINYLRRMFPHSMVRVCLIPHGLVSVELIPLNASRRMKFLKKKCHPANLLFPMLDYYIPAGDLIGGTDGIVQSVYTFSGIATPYVAEKVIELTDLKSYIQSISKARIGRSAMIIGQPLLKNGSISESAHALVREQIRNWLNKHGFVNVYYSKHPRSGDFLDFFADEYQLIKQKGPVEIALCELQPEVVISCYSTALATAKILFADDVRCISFGLSLTQSDKREALARYFQTIGVELH